ncbi:hypothetical protein LX12_003346 [Williamsia serinedens]|uniref:Uncharacterized protein n=2 Tax=Williamsia serinedens TaxID=391736 RepID=A0ABT1H8A2_9NOCA|nr:hypothetical protein [Williamsia serinedens]
MTWRPVDPLPPGAGAGAAESVSLVKASPITRDAVVSPQVAARPASPATSQLPAPGRDDTMRVRLIAVVSVAVVVVAIATGGWWLSSEAPWGQHSAASPGVVPPEAADAEGASSSSVGTCGAGPQVRPATIAPGGDGLTLDATMSTPCTGGDILSSDETGVVVTEGSRLVAAASFDLSSTPVALTGTPRQVELVFPPGSYFDLPDATADLQSAVVAVTQVSPRTVTYLPAADPSAVRLTASTQLAPAGVDTESSAAAGLAARVAADRDVVAAQDEGRWVAQLSSKRAGLVADGRVWDSKSILAEFAELAARFGGARLLQSDEWSVFTSPGLLVTVTDQSFPDPAAAVGWCRSNGFDRDHCLAKMISRTAPAEGTTVYTD